MAESLRTQFDKQRWDARRRGIAWQLTFEEWLRVWVSSGHLQERGRRCGQYVMARYGNVGPFSIDNVRVAGCQTNKGYRAELDPDAAELARWNKGSWKANLQL